MGCEFWECQKMGEFDAITHPAKKINIFTIFYNFAGWVSDPKLYPIFYR